MKNSPMKKLLSQHTKLTYFLNCMLLRFARLGHHHMKLSTDRSFDFAVTGQTEKLERERVHSREYRVHNESVEQLHYFMAKTLFCQTLYPCLSV